MRRLYLSLGFWLVFSAGAAFSQETSGLDADIRAALVNRTEEAQNAAGIVVGLLNADGERFLTSGYVDIASSKAPRPDSLFRIGGVTILFSATLLADMVERGELEFDDPISRYVPEGVVVPDYEGREITLADLAMSLSGLPLRPPLGPALIAEPSRITADDLYASLSGYSLTRAPGEYYEGSFWGGALLVDILARHAGMHYSDLLRERIFEPLGMHDTTYVLNDEQRERLAVGYTPGLNPARPQNLGAIELGTGVYSTAEDMLRFAAAFLQSSDSPLDGAMRRARSVVRPVQNLESPSAVRLGWVDLDGNVLFRSASILGFTASIAIDPNRQQAAVVLINTLADLESSESIALHAVKPAHPVASYAARDVPSEVVLTAETLDEFVGVYRIDPASDIPLPIEIEIDRRGDSLYATLGRQRAEIRIVPISDSEFHIEGDDTMRFLFHRNSSGQVIGATQLRPVGPSFPLIRAPDTP